MLQNGEWFKVFRVKERAPCYEIVCVCITPLPLSTVRQSAAIWGHLNRGAVERRALVAHTMSLDDRSRLLAPNAHALSNHANILSFLMCELLNGSLVHAPFGWAFHSRPMIFLDSIDGAHSRRILIRITMLPAQWVPGTLKFEE